MNKEKFDEIFEDLTPRRRQVLRLLLESKKNDQVIATSIGISRETVRTHVKNICKAFGLKNQPGEQFSNRPELIALFSKYKPEWVGSSAPAIATSADTLEAEPQLDKGAKSESDPNFVGREEAIAHLNTRVSQGAKVIVIQAPGGVGKTTLAQQYLKTQGFDLVLELLMAKEKENITAVESVIEEWLKQDFQEEPGREFGVTLGRLKRQLQTRRVGVLIDNLEPALDKQGRFIEPHRRYVELLRVLADSTVQSVTLITSREPLGECVDVANYSLPRLNERAWQEFFSSRNIDIDDTALREMHKAYDGNALAMKVLCDPIVRDAGMAAYWREHKIEADLLVELAVENLIKDQFNRLEEIYPEAYRLLCRLGCYRYQDVTTVPAKGLFCLLWDVPEAQHKRIIESLRNRSLVECQKGEYLLHPVIRAEAIVRLRASEEWEVANRKAANFWSDSIESVTTPEEGLKKLEAYYHYIALEDWEKASQVLVDRIENKSVSFLARLRSVGYSHKCIDVTNNLLSKPNISKQTIGVIYAILGDVYSIVGRCSNAIYNYNNSLSFVNFVNKSGFEVDVMGALAIIYMKIGDYEESIKLLKEVIPHAEKINNEGRKFLAYIHSSLSLAYHYAKEGKNSALHLDYAINFQTYLEETNYTWIKSYGLYNLGRSLNTHGHLNEAREIYNKLYKYSKQSSHLQAMGFFLNGTGEIFLKENRVEQAIEEHEKARQIFSQIGANFDVAETYYYLGLSYQRLGVSESSQANFDEAIRLFEEMEAPKQVEKVRQAMEAGG